MGAAHVKWAKNQIILINLCNCVYSSLWPRFIEQNKHQFKKRDSIVRKIYAANVQLVSEKRINEWRVKKIDGLR